MKHTPTTIHTADGSSVTISRRGLEFDLETRNAKGETISTVVMSQNDLDALYMEMDEHTTVEWEAA
ncbi:hypothetical protein ACFRCI_23480 [Streptomyces sp. NPDC056638]|uniref:hypothetical protein n=1 Tax=Streptomyces sp. NPDC056638 TaxID=3345887 RepID=UPI0036B971F8